MITQPKLMDAPHDWSLFLDRDGVLNKRPGLGYVCRYEDFQWIPGSLESLPALGNLFRHVVVVSNQQGVAKGLMRDGDLLELHQQMCRDVEQAGGRIDRVYAATGARCEDSYRRKPGVGMAMEAQADFPAIRFPKSIMVGDTFRDMLFGKRLGMLTALIATERPFSPHYHRLADFHFASLSHFANFMIRYFNT